LTEWLAGQYHFLPLERSEITEKDTGAEKFVLRPQE
jgi:hypothetical protein